MNFFEANLPQVRGRLRVARGAAASAYATAGAGFTLIELLVVIAVIGILTAITVPTIRTLSKSNDQSQATNVLRSMISNARSIAISQHRLAGVVLFQETTSYALPVHGNQTAMQLIVADYDQSSTRYPGILAGVTAFIPYSTARQYLPEGIQIAMLSDNVTSGSGIAGIENNNSGQLSRVILFDANGQLTLRDGLATYDPGIGGTNKGTYPTAFGDWMFLAHTGARSTPLPPGQVTNAYSSPGFFIYSKAEMDAYNQANATASDTSRAGWLRNHSSLVIINGNTGSVLR